MELPLSTKIGKISSIYAFMKQILVYLLSGIFSAISHGKGACDGVGGTQIQQTGKFHVIRFVLVFTKC